jgi:hypothetical protein
MRGHEKKLTHERLLEALAFDPETGVFTHRKGCGKAKAGAVAGYIDHHGERRIGVDGTRYAALRLAYFYIHGHWPSGAVIPADEDLDNARIANLRVVPEISASELPKRRSDLTVELVRKLFSYEGGRLFWACHCYQAKIRFGMEAGTFNYSGYRVITIKGIKYRAHQIAWAHHHGEWLSEGKIDHENGMEHDNRIENLRKATLSQNAANTNKRKGSNTGIRGVHRTGNGRYKVTCGTGKSSHKGTFADIGLAILARQAAAKERYGEFARG